PERQQLGEEGGGISLPVAVGPTRGGEGRRGIAVASRDERARTVGNLNADARHGLRLEPRRQQRHHLVAELEARIENTNVGGGEKAPEQRAFAVAGNVFV